MANEIPAAIVEAEWWRLAGENLRERSPQLFREIMTVLVALAVRSDEDDPARITEGYLIA